MDAPRFFFDYGSPTTYLAWKRLAGLQVRTGVRFELVPVLLGGIFKASGNNSPVLVPGKFKWMVDDLALWANREGIPFAFNPHFPINTLKLMRGAVAADIRKELELYSDAMFDAIWRDGRNLADWAEAQSVLLENGLDADAYTRDIEEPAIKAKLVETTDAAAAAGLFGAPSFIVGDKLFFGQDRMAFVEAALGAGA